MSRSLLLDAAKVLKGASMVLTEMAKLQPGAAGTAANSSLHNVKDVISTKKPTSPKTSSSTPPIAQKIDPMIIVNGADLPPIFTTKDSDSKD